MVSGSLPAARASAGGTAQVGPSRVQAATVAGRRTLNRPHVGRPPHGGAGGLLLGVLVVVLVGLSILLIDVLRAPDRHDEPTLTWSEDTGTGIAYAVGLNGRGIPIWRCTRDAGRVACLGQRPGRRGGRFDRQSRT